MPSGLTPDFLATSQSCTEFYLDATVVEPKTFQDSPSEKQVVDALNECNCPDFWLFAEVTGILRSTPPLKRMQHTTQSWIDGLHWYEAVQDAHSSYGKYPSCSITHDEWTLTLEAVPRGEAHRGKHGGRPLAGISRADFIDPAKPLILAVREKAQKYKGLDGPLVVAINRLGLASVNRNDVLLALFGWEASTDVPGLARITPPSGFQRRSHLWDAKKNTGVSAILLFNEVQPHTMASAPVCLYENPWASHPIPISLRHLPHAIVEGEFIRWYPGEALHSILGLPGNWPGTR